MGWNDDEDNDTNLDDEDTPRTKKKLRFPRCYVDKKHDNDPICKECALEEYGKTPKAKFKGPRNCWRCEELGVDPVLDDDYDSDEPYYE